MAAAKSNKTKKNNELSPMEKELLECAIRRKPVLLYGKRINDVIDFVKNISERMSRAWKSLNFYALDGEDFYNKFTKFHKAAQFLEDRHWSRLRCADNLFCTIFIDNLHYYPGKEGEEENYNEAGKIISKHMLSYIGYPVPSVPNKYSVDNVDAAVEAAAAIAAAAYADAYPDDDKEEENIATVYHVDWIVVYTDRSDTFPSYFRKQFEEISLDSESDEGGQQEKIFNVSVSAIEESKPKRQPQEVESIETTLFYNKTTAKFRFGNTESVAISKTAITRKRKIAERLMEYWKNGKPCPLSEIVEEPKNKIPQGVHDDISMIRGILSTLGVNLQQCTTEGYLPPDKVKHFNITG